MSYQERDGEVVLTMSREDYERVLFRLGAALGSKFGEMLDRDEELKFLNRLNSGNPNYTPYQVEEKKPGQYRKARRTRAR